MACFLRLQNDCGYSWIKRIYDDGTEIYVKGIFLNGGQVLSGEDFVEQLYFKIDNGIYDFVNRLDGHFAIVIKQATKFHAFVDHMRSIPLFLIEKNNEYFIADSVDKRDVLSKRINNLQKDLFLNSLYTSEEKTLFNNVLQIPAGCAIEVSSGIHNLKRYWKFEYSSAQISDLDEAIKHIKNGYDDLFALVKAMIGERQIVIPLSGGYDSRLILNGLIKSGVDKSKIVTFTYGSMNNADAVISKKVANALGVKHYYINYNTKKARRFFAKELEKYCNFAGNLVAVPHIQDLYAVFILKEQGIISKDSVFVPGHGGPLAGECLYNEFFNKEKCNKEFVLDLLKNHVLIHHSKRDKKLVEKLKKILFETSYFNSNDAPLNVLPFGYETFYYFERQAKFILNSVRVYEFFGFAWLSPLFFKQQFDVWGKVSNELRVNLFVFKEAIKNYWVPELKGIEFTGTKVAKKTKINNRYLMFVISVFKLLVCREKVHYIFAMIPAKIFYKHFLRNKLCVNLNHLIAEIYLRQF